SSKDGSRGVPFRFRLVVRARPGQGVAPSTGSGGHCGHDEVLVPISLPCEPTDRVEGRRHRWATDTYTVVMDATGARILAGTSSSCSGVAGLRPSLWGCVACHRADGRGRGPFRRKLRIRWTHNSPYVELYRKLGLPRGVQGSLRVE